MCVDQLYYYMDRTKLDKLVSNRRVTNVIRTSFPLNSCYVYYNTCLVANNILFLSQNDWALWFVFMQTDFFAFQFALELIIDLTFKYAKQTNLFSRGFMELSVD